MPKGVYARKTWAARQKGNNRRKSFRWDNDLKRVVDVDDSPKEVIHEEVNIPHEGSLLISITDPDAQCVFGEFRITFRQQ